MTEKSRVISLLSSFAGLLLAVGSMTVFSACGPRDDGTWMNCHNAQNYVALCGAGLAVLFMLATFVNNTTIKMICMLAALVLSVITFMIPGNLVPMCMLSNMHCQAVLKPFARIMSSVIVLFALWGILCIALGEKMADKWHRE